MEIGEQIRNKLLQRTIKPISNIILNKYNERFGQFFILFIWFEANQQPGKNNARAKKKLFFLSISFRLHAEKLVIYCRKFVYRFFVHLLYSLQYLFLLPNSMRNALVFGNFCSFLLFFVYVSHSAGREVRDTEERVAVRKREGERESNRNFFRLALCSEISCISVIFLNIRNRQRCERKQIEAKNKRKQ